MNKIHHFRKPLILAAAAALVLALGMGAYAAGWFSPIFHGMRSFLPASERDAVYAAAEEYMNERQPEPETVALPEFDGSRVTLSERYYDGEHLLLGIRLEEAVPAPAVGFVPEASLLERISAVAFFHDAEGDDNLDHLLEQGMDREIYDDYLANRSDSAKEYDFRSQSAIEFDWYLLRTLTEEDYEEAWRLLRETGSLCVVYGSVYIGDHIRLEDGTDLGAAGQQNMDSDAPDARSGSIFFEASDLPEAARNREALDIRLTLKNTRTYYYMELGGPAYFYNETAGVVPVSFTVENGAR